jgi:hypothetical protein
MTLAPIAAAPSADRTGAFRVDRTDVNWRFPMNKHLAGAIAVAAIVSSAAAAHAETCLWVGYWACGDSDNGAYYTHYYQLPTQPDMALKPLPVQTAPSPPAAADLRP